MPSADPLDGLGGLPRRAFTLIEVMVALAIGGLAVLIAAAMLSTVSDGVRIVTQAAQEQDAAANGERVLRRLIGQMTWANDSEPPPLGDAVVFRFTSWCAAPAGWQERCQVELRLHSGRSDVPGIEVSTSIGDRFLILLGRSIKGFLYLESPEHGGRWRERWSGGVSLPPAIGIVRDADTLLIRTGSRG